MLERSLTCQKIIINLNPDARKNYLTNVAFLLYNRPGQLNSLIKSGGGNGPVKPGNLRQCARC